MKLVFDHIATAIRSLKMNRIRSFLTTLGVAIGVASITTIVSLSTGVAQVVTRQIETIGEGIAVIRPGVEKKTTTETLLSPITPQRYNVSTLTEVDVDALAKIDTSVAVAPVMTMDIGVSTQGGKQQTTTIVATTPSFNRTTALPVQEGGQFIDTMTAPQSAVVGAQLALDMFGTDNPIGQTFKVKDQTFTVIGTLKRSNNPINYNSIDFDRCAIVASAAGKLLNQGVMQIQQVNVYADSPKKLTTVLASMSDELEKRHGNRDFTIKVGKDIATPTNKLFDLMTAVMTAIAAISLIVGGVGIMNIMLVNVAERTREIGIRKAVGASNGSIALQFMIESLIVSLCGGIMGYIAGVGVAFAIGIVLGFTPAYTLTVALWALGVSLATGVLFGFYPAIRAAQKDPIESLRQYR